ERGAAMRLSFLLLFLLLVVSVNSQAQAGGSGGTGGSTGSTGGGSRGSGNGSTLGNAPTQPRNLPSPRNPAPILYLSGKVVVDDGTEITTAAAIQTSCRGSSHTVGYTDSKGSFSVQLDPNANPATSGIGDVTDTNSTVRDQSDQNWRTHGWNDCQIRALLSGYTSQVVDLAAR